MVTVDLYLRSITEFSLVVRYAGALGVGVVNEVFFLTVGALDPYVRARKC
jgi:hypothetical protein